MLKTRKAILDVLQSQKPDHTPIWLMRQAGRYLPEYREIRSKAKDFLNMCLTPDWATEITLQPIRHYDMDAAILFADILLIPMALGLQLAFREGEGPILEKITDPAALARLSYQNQKVEPVFETVRRVRAALPGHTTLIGFCGSPWTVACYMIDGSSKNAFAAAKDWTRARPETLDALLSLLIEASDAYLSSQIEAGAEALQLFDSWAGLLSGADFTRFVIEPTRKLVSRLKRKYPHIPIIGFPREAGEGYAPYVRETGVDALSLDPSVNLAAAKRDLQTVKPLQGNLAPELLIEGGEKMKQAAAAILETLGPTHIFNLGHGVTPQTPPEHVAELVAFVQAYGK